MGSSSSNAREAAAAAAAAPPPPPSPPAPQAPLHVMDADEDDESVKQLNECAALYLSLQDCLAESDRNWKACQAHVQALKACEAACQRHLTCIIFVKTKTQRAGVLSC